MQQTIEEKTGNLIDLLGKLIKNKEWLKTLIIGEYLATLDPEEILAYRAMGIASLELHDLDQSEKYFHQTLECGDDDPEEKKHPLLKFLGYFWGPIPWMIEIAAILSAVLLLEGYLRS